MESLENLNGATVLHSTQAAAEKVAFRVWAPNARQLTLRLLPADGESKTIELRPDLGKLPGRGRDSGIWEAMVEAHAGDRYYYAVDGRQVPDPVSRLLPEGVHGPTEIVDPLQFFWSDSEWRGLPFSDYVLYELHLGTFSPEGTFDGAVKKLDALKRLGVTAIELMPVNAFPGRRNWGYDGVGLYAVQASYGGPEAFRRFVDEAHRRGLAVVLDVVYNHLGNEGNYLRLFGPYFTAHHHTPWGEAVNYDDAGCEGVRRFVVDNALYWLTEYHLDGLRLDAVQTIRDNSPRHIVAEIAQRAHALGKRLQRTICVMAETDENDARYVLPPSRGGDGLDAMWSDDFHHVLHAMFTGERAGYYQDFGAPRQLVKVLNEGYVFQGEFFNFWKDARGTSAGDVPLPANIICIQNHDQVGNRAQGERLTALVPRGVRKLMAAILLLAPHTPLIFMGQEFDAETPFQFFTDFADPTIQQAVSEGRRNEFKDFAFGDVPDPQHPATFERSRLRPPPDEPDQTDQTDQTDKNDMLLWYRRLLDLRSSLFPPQHAQPPRVSATSAQTSDRTCYARLLQQDAVLHLYVPRENPRLLLTCNLKPDTPLAQMTGWQLRLSSEEDGYAVRVWTR
jgi:maltooligosyltrehalose trehalohydrolase